ncbi:tetratricopeptide repeat protein [Thalassotalea sp. M1531]|uniref:Tetratricopeptide repeat protein n=1 Tax=Thalassotalea algicola TaxID=2716224 RepID=A0A7Y0LDT2_9GAMM|nr:tetratricopeptide repeat protein [Thalassotalea algicola]NMP32339.1 tetratricopeptide repeat protein [Thalassotalea algicola]
MKKVYTLSFLFCIAVSGCVSTQENQYAKQALDTKLLLNDEIFPIAKHVPIESKKEIFHLSDEMKNFVRQELDPLRTKHHKVHHLVKHIFNNDNVGLAYLSNANLVAEQAYNNKKANCMSLTIMAYALAKEAGLDANFQDVLVPEYWVRNGQYSMLTGHVNLKIKGVKQPNTSIVWGEKSFEVDFDPFIRKKNFDTEVIGKSTVVAMFYNNKGAQALVESQYNKAYAYFKAAILEDVDYAPSWGNLGILYRFLNEVELAENTYQHAISLAPNSLNSMTNLAILLERQGRYDESRRLDSAIIKQRIKNPYYHALLADEAFYEGRFESAVRHYRRGIKINGEIHELYFGLAKVFDAMGRKDQARTAMKKAINANKIPDVERQYIAKLSLLKQ